MAAYLLKRVLLIFPTMLGIMLISFCVIQFAPGGPIERIIAQLSGTEVSATARIGDAWIGSGNSPVLRVPSAVVRDEWNYLLNPAHPAFSKMKIGRARPFAFDSRLSPRSRR